MKKKGLVLMALTVAYLCGNPALGYVIASDDFDHMDGALEGEAPNLPAAAVWTQHSGSGNLNVASGAAVVQHNSDTQDLHIPFASVSGDIYFGVDFSVSASGDITGGDYEYFIHFRDNAFGFAARLDVVEATGAGNYSVGIASDESVADAVWATDLTFGVVYRAVVRYNQDDNIAELWIDPVNVASTSILGEDRGDPGDTVTNVALRQSDSSLDETVTVDNLLVGTTFDDVLTYVPVELMSFGIE